MNFRRAHLGPVGSQQLSLGLVFALVCIAFSSQTDRFFTLPNLTNILTQSSAAAVVALGMTLVIVTRGIDLSVGSIANCAIATALLLAGTESVAGSVSTSIWVYPIALAIGLMLGLLNGVLVVAFKVHPLIITLATLSLFRGIGLHITAAESIGVKGSLLNFARYSPGGLPLPVITVMIGAFVAWVVLKRTLFGRHLLALGGSPRSAAETGIKVKRLIVSVYAISGVCAAVAGLIVSGRVGLVDTSLGLELEFTAITAVVLGGTSLFGGRGTVVGSMLGAILLVTIDNGLNLIGANPFIYAVVRGLILIVAIALDAFAGRNHPDRLASDLS
ncbi:ABC transporter permease [Mesorhizobium sp. CO1-1-8]|uniref:ABC transporter permease n=1 Tax=Mesorhizobium sp. CO1-1-8 TaxID=2876631 RepID=UPI001CD0820C|nr:ABC transporter permease [Mesorhizobium sp. CO1-1-8]MBZ9772407.1 ABC transporter permease [Mesorhizobium sp. CO1-1-8]